jgi:hypothetical protein
VIFLLVLAITAISMKIHSYAHPYTVALVIILVVLLIFKNSLEPPSLAPTQCTFNSPGFTCVIYKLQAETSELDFRLGNGLKNEIRVVGAKCIKAETWNISAPTYIEPPNQSILIPSGEAAWIFGEGTNNTIYCKNEDGSLPSDAHLDSPVACLSVYINYTDTATGESNTTKVAIRCKYEP